MQNMGKKVKQSSKNRSKSPGPNLKNIVPIGIRVRKLASYTAINILQKETRRVYNLLLDEDSENFPGWKIEPGYII